MDSSAVSVRALPDSTIASSITQSEIDQKRAPIRSHPVIKNYFSYFLIKTNVVGTQKNRLLETVLFENPKQMLKSMNKKIFKILCAKKCLSGPMAHTIFYLKKHICSYK